MPRVFLVAAALLAFPAWAQADAALVERLREGGYVLYMRHAATDMSRNDAGMKSYEDCANQRNLTDRGREDARAIAAHIQRLRIPIGKVLASPFCRTMETARLAFGRAEASSEARSNLKELLSSPVATGENLAISSHGNPFYAVAGPPYLAEGEIAVVRPEGGLSFTVVARIRPEDWRGLRAAGDRAS
jgi:Histidine phosphatase superfamily (branch 1)